MKITKYTLYWNEVHYKWMPVPVHWIGTYAYEYTHRFLNDER